MDWLTGIQNAINYVEEHLTEEIDYEEVAKEAACSNFYFQRIFGILCGISLGDYIRNRRLTLAGSELSVSDDKVIDIALKYGYESPESFFKISWGYTFGSKKRWYKAQILFPNFRENHIKRR